MIRYHDWPERLTMFLSGRDHLPFEWGKSDCCLMACDSVKALTGADPAHFFRNKYSDMRGAFKLLKQFSGGGVDETATKIFADMGYPEIQAKDVVSGDVALVDVKNVHPDAHGLTMAVVINNEMVVAQGKDSLVYLEHPNIQKAWHL